MIKKLLLLLFALSPLQLLAQSLPENEDYLALSASEPGLGSYIFKQSKQVFYGYHYDSKTVDNQYSTSSKRIKTLFRKADEMDFERLAKSSTALAQTSDRTLRTIEYRKKGKVYKVLWDVNGTDADSKQLEDLVGIMDGFW